ncbi:MAG: 6-hydroxymethylpterin diphosphokinase MptE-like protein [bacterium]
MEKTILEKNLEQISRYNKKLAEKIAKNDKFDCEFEFLEAKSGDVILSYNNILLHDSIDPQEEAFRIFNNLSNNTKSTINILFGLGLGYLFKRFSLSCKGKIVIYEPNLDILRITLEIIDFSKELNKDTVVLVDSIEDIEKSFERLYFDGAEVTLSFLDSYTKLYPDAIQDLVNDIGFIKGLYSSNYSNLFRKCSEWTIAGINNIPEMIGNQELESLRQKFVNKPAVIISAGPSLDKNIDILYEYQDKVLTFCVGTALKTAVKHKIKPDFLAIVEYHDCSAQISGIDVSKMNLILHPMTFKSFHDLPAKHKFNYYPNNDFTTKWLAKFLDISLDDYLNKGTVSLCALFSAKILGCNPIILIGQDLAYSEGRCYSQDSPYHNLKCKKNQETGKMEVGPDDLESYIKTMNHDEELAKLLTESRFKDITENLYFVKGQNGKMLPTEPGYATFIRYFENAATEFGDKIKFINSTEGGAYIEGFEHIPLKQVLENHANAPIDVESIIQESLKSGRNLQQEKSSILLKAIDETIELLQTSFEYFEHGKSSVIRLNKQFNTGRFYNKQFKRYCEEVLKNFIIIEEKFLNQNLLLLGLIFPEYSKLSNHLAVTDGSVDIDSIKKFIELAKNVFIHGYNRLKNDLEAIKEMRKRLYDSCNSTC